MNRVFCFAYVDALINTHSHRNGFIWQLYFPFFRRSVLVWLDVSVAQRIRFVIVVRVFDMTALLVRSRRGMKAICKWVSLVKGINRAQSTHSTRRGLDRNNNNKWKKLCCENVIIFYVCVSMRVNYLHIFLSAILNRGRRYSSNVFYVNIVRTHVVSDFSERDFFFLVVVIINIEINMTRERESRGKAMSLNTKRAHEKKKWNVNQIGWRETREKSRAHRSWIRNNVFFFLLLVDQRWWIERNILCRMLMKFIFVTFFGPKCCEMKPIDFCSCYRRHFPVEGDYYASHNFFIPNLQNAPPTMSWEKRSICIDVGMKAKFTNIESGTYALVFRSNGSSTQTHYWLQVFRIPIEALMIR